MNQAEIKRKRTESVLKEVLPEAFSMLDDKDLNSLSVTEVICSRGRYDAKVFLDKSSVEKSNEEVIIKKLNRVQGFLKNYVKESQGWFRSPNFKFVFDDYIDSINRIDQLFKQIKKD